MADLLRRIRHWWRELWRDERRERLAAARATYEQLPVERRRHVGYLPETQILLTHDPASGELVEWTFLPGLVDLVVYPQLKPYVLPPAWLR